MADASSSGEGIEENPIETAISRGASLSEPTEASISRKRKVIVNHGKYKASREQKNLNSKTSVLGQDSRPPWSTFRVRLDT